MYEDASALSFLDFHATSVSEKRGTGSPVQGNSPKLALLPVWRSSSSVVQPQP